MPNPEDETPDFENLDELQFDESDLATPDEENLDDLQFPGEEGAAEEPGVDDLGEMQFTPDEPAEEQPGEIDFTDADSTEEEAPEEEVAAEDTSEAEASEEEPVAADEEAAAEEEESEEPTPLDEMMFGVAAGEAAAETGAEEAEEEESEEEPGEKAKKKSAMPVLVELIAVGAICVGLPLLAVMSPETIALDLAIYLAALVLIPFAVWRSRATATPYFILLAFALAALCTAVFCLWQEMEAYDFDFKAKEATSQMSWTAPEQPGPSNWC